MPFSPPTTRLRPAAFCFIEPPIGNVEERFVVSAVAIGLEEMHHPERTKKRTQAGAGAQQSRECQKIEKGFSDKER